MKPISPSEEEINHLILAGTTSLSDFYEVYAGRFVPELSYQPDAYYSTNYFLTGSDQFPIDPPYMVRQTSMPFLCYIQILYPHF